MIGRRTLGRLVAPAALVPSATALDLGAPTARAPGRAFVLEHAAALLGLRWGDRGDPQLAGVVVLERLLPAELGERADDAITLGEAVRSGGALVLLQPVSLACDFAEPLIASLPDVAMVQARAALLGLLAMPVAAGEFNTLAVDGAGAVVFVADLTTLRRGARETAGRKAS